MVFEGNILELRTSVDGDYDWTRNTWVADEIALVTDRGTYILNSPKYGSSNWKINHIVACERKEFPYMLKNFSGKNLRYKSYVDCEGLVNLTLFYEDAYLWITPESGCSMVSLHGYDNNTDEFLSRKDTPRSSYIAWDEEDDYFCIEFDRIAG